MINPGALIFMLIGILFNLKVATVKCLPSKQILFVLPKVKNTFYLFGQ